MRFTALRFERNRPSDQLLRGPVVVCPAEYYGFAQQRESCARSKRGGGAEAFDGRSTAPLPLQQPAEFIVCLRQRRPQPRGILTLLDSSGTRTQCLQRKCHIVMRQPGLRIESEGLGETIDRSLELAFR